MDYVKLAELAPAYIGLIIFVWYTITRDREWRQYLADHDDKQNALLAKQDEKWILFLDRERDQRREIMHASYADFRSGMGSLTETVEEVAKSMAVHENTAIQRNERILSVLEKLVEITVKHDERALEHIFVTAKDAGGD